MKLNEIKISKFNGTDKRIIQEDVLQLTAHIIGTFLKLQSYTEKYRYRVIPNLP